MSLNIYYPYLISFIFFYIYKHTLTNEHTNRNKAEKTKGEIIGKNKKKKKHQKTKALHHHKKKDVKFRPPPFVILFYFFPFFLFVCFCSQMKRCGVYLNNGWRSVVKSGGKETRVPVTAHTRFQSRKVRNKKNIFLY